jgi:hypothetical protein
LWWAVDLLASEYGGGPRAILDGVYLDEMVYLIQVINKRKLREYRMQLAIAENPHKGKEHKALWDALNEADPQEKQRKNKLDTAGFAALKMAMSKNPKFIVK